jgi:hypothetical protein
MLQGLLLELLDNAPVGLTRPIALQFGKKVVNARLASEQAVSNHAKSI